MRLTVRRLITALIVIAAAAAITWSLVPRQIPVETAAVTKGRFVATVDEDGRTRVRERYVVAAPLTGRLTRIRLKSRRPGRHRRGCCYDRAFSRPIS